MRETIATLRAEARRLAEHTIGPLAETMDREGGFPPSLWPALGEAGLLGITVSTELGGRGLDYAHHLACMEEVSRVSPSAGLSYAAHSNLCLDNLYLHGNEAQRRRYLPDLCAGRRVGALAISEPEAGSDVIGSMSAHAERAGSQWVANGRKTWITNGSEADVLIVYLRTAGAGSRSITAFLVERGLPGFRASAPMDKLGMRGSNTAELRFCDCRIPDQNVLGEVDEGTGILMQGLDSERLILSGGPIGLMRAVLETVLPWVRERQQFGQAIGRFELIQAKLADLHARLQAARAYAYALACGFSSNRHARRDAAACLLFAAEAAMSCALEGVQILGGRGYLNDAHASRLLRDAKIFAIGGGTNEIRRILVGRELYRDEQALDWLEAGE